MKQSKISASMLLLAVLSVIVLAVSPASARHGSDDTAVAVSSTSESGDDSASSNNSGSGSSSKSPDDDTEVEVHKSNSEHVATIRAEAKAKVAELREQHKSSSVEKRQKLCVNRQKTVNNKVKAFGTAADKHLARLDGVFTKLQAYQNEKNLDVANYQALVDDANAKQAAATTAVGALKTVAVNIDCTSTDPASSLTVVKTSATDARAALKDYRKSLKAIVVALAQAKDMAATDESAAQEGTN